MFPRVQLHPIEFPVFYKISNTFINFKNDEKCLRITIEDDGRIEIIEDDTIGWISLAMSLGHKCSKTDWAEGLMMATIRIQSYYKPEPVASVVVYDGMIENTLYETENR